MDTASNPLASPYVNINEYKGRHKNNFAVVPASVSYDYSYDDETAHTSHGVVLHRQWVTLTAGMWPSPATAAPALPANRLPLLVAVFCGAALVVCLICAFLLYRCCVLMPKRDKHFCFRKTDDTPALNNTPVQSTIVSPITSNMACGVPSSHSAVFAERKGGGSGWGYTNRLVPTRPNPWYTPRIIGGPQCTQCPGICPVPRSSSNPGASVMPSVISSTQSTRKQRPVSQPITTNIHDNEIVPKSPLPEICEFAPNRSQYASSSILDDFNPKEPNSTEPHLKTRSLPAWVRSKPRPLSTEDDINDLYAKVNFSKKRKNRMRNDEAAIIALSKSRSQFLHKDTDSLVDNEAVIVYDERTAL